MGWGGGFSRSPSRGGYFEEFPAAQIKQNFGPGRPREGDFQISYLVAVVLAISSTQVGPEQEENSRTREETPHVAIQPRLMKSALRFQLPKRQIRPKTSKNCCFHLTNFRNCPVASELR